MGSAKCETMAQALDHEKKERMIRATEMDKVPLLQLDRLIKERRLHAVDGNADAVRVLNELICQLLGI